jgi:hypothetical protein
MELPKNELASSREQSQGLLAQLDPIEFGNKMGEVSQQILNIVYPVLEQHLVVKGSFHMTGISADNRLMVEISRVMVGTSSTISITLAGEGGVTLTIMCDQAGKVRDNRQDCADGSRNGHIQVYAQGTAEKQLSDAQQILTALGTVSRWEPTLASPALKQ